MFSDLTWVKYEFIYIFRDAFVDYWINDNKITMDTASQIFEILRKPDYNYLTQVCNSCAGSLSPHTSIFDYNWQRCSYMLLIFFDGITSL